MKVLKRRELPPFFLLEGLNKLENQDVKCLEEQDEYVK